MTDVFHEVDEQLRADKAKRLFLAALPWAVSIAVAALVITFIYWGWTAYQAKAAARASDAYANGVKAWNAGDDTAAKKDFDIAASAGSRAYKTLALMQEGQMAAATGKPPREAADLFDKAAAASPSPLLADLAKLQAAYVLLDTTPYKDMEARLTPLTGDKGAYRLEAKEALAFAKLLNGDSAGARTAFNALMLNAEAPQGVKQRAQAAIMTIDSGAAKAIPAIVKDGAARPAEPRIPDDVMQKLQQQIQQAQQGAAGPGGPGAPGAPVPVQ